MSGLAKKAKKVFKKVADVARVVAPAVLTAAAVYFTAGAAAPMIGSISSFLGGGTLGNVVAGAATNAALGAGIGGLSAALTGGNVGQGALLGGLSGAAIGGVRGATMPTTTGQMTDGVGRDQLRGSAGGDLLMGGNQSATGTGTATGTGLASGNAALGTAPMAAPPTGSGLLGAGGWLERNQILAGNLISGIGTGLLADDPGRAQRQIMRDERRYIQGNYGDASAAGYRAAANVPGRWDPRRDYDGVWEFDRQQGRLVFRRGDTW